MKLSHDQEEEIISFARELIGFPGLSGDEEKTAACVERKMESLGYDEVSKDAYGNVLGVLEWTRPGPTIIFDAHMDVVSIKEPDLWEHAPYAGERSEGKIWGRGSVDMKGPLAAMVCAPAYLNRDDFAGKVIVSTSVAEEYLPSRAFTEILKAHSVDAVVIAEPTQMKLGVAEKGRAGIEMTAIGKVAHSSRPELGENAVYRMMDAIARIRAIPKRKHPFLGNEVIELVEISSHPQPGNGSVPDRCDTFWECRLLQGETKDSFLNRWKEALSGLDKVSLEVATLNLDCYTGAELIMDDFLPGWISEEDQPFRAQVKSAMEANELNVELYAAPFGCNALASASNRGIPTVILGPGDVGLAHRPNEFIEIEELLLAAKVYGTIVEMNPPT
jgi:putative selenium metabolism hydrolase